MKKIQKIFLTIYEKTVKRPLQKWLTRLFHKYKNELKWKTIASKKIFVCRDIHKQEYHVLNIYLKKRFVFYTLQVCPCQINLKPPKNVIVLINNWELFDNEKFHVEATPFSTSFITKTNSINLELSIKLENYIEVYDSESYCAIKEIFSLLPDNSIKYNNIKII